MKIRQMEPLLSQIRDDHVARYQFAIDKLIAAHVKEPILDVGCGVGYGSKMMATNLGTLVLAIDTDKGAIDYAFEHYYTEKVAYVLADLGLSTTEYLYKQFSIITMFEVIEHSIHAPAFMKCASQHAKTLFGSVPNENVVPFARGGWNAEHYRHYTPEEITEELRTSGWKVKIIGSQIGKHGPKAVINTRNLKGRTIVFMAESTHV